MRRTKPSTITEEPRIGDDELESLFDLSTVSALIEEDDNVRKRNSKGKIVSTDRLALDGFGRVVVEKELYMSYDEPNDDMTHVADPLNLFDTNVEIKASPPKRPTKKDLFVGDVYSHNMPLMPCAKNNLDNIDRGFSEPVRNRDKDYKAEQMQIMENLSRAPDYTQRYLVEHHSGDAEEKKQSPEKTKKGLPMSKSAPGGLQMGKYKLNIEVPPNFWSPQFQSLIRRTKMMRCTKYISETYCVIDVFGVGISGRVFSGGPGRMIIVEAYSTWNSEKHIILLTVPMLKEMLAEDETLFRPGNKRKLVDTIISYLFFTYTIEPALLVSDLDSRRSSRSTITRGATTAKRASSHGTAPGRTTTSGTMGGVSRPVTGFMDDLPEGLDEDISRPASRFERPLSSLPLREEQDEQEEKGDLVDSAYVNVAKNIAEEEMSIVSMASMEKDDLLTRREARAIARKARMDAPIYLGLIPSGVDAPADLTQWESMRADRMAQMNKESDLNTQRLEQQGLPADMQLFEPGSPPSSAGTVVKAPNSASGWSFAPGVIGEVPFSAGNPIGNTSARISARDSAQGDPSPLSTGRSNVSHSSLNTRQSAINEAVEKLLPKPDLRMQVVEGTQEPRPIRPDLVGYPIRVSEIMRTLSDPSIGEESAASWKGYGLPTLTQELKVGKFVRPSAWHLREAKERARVFAEAEEDARQKAAWLAIPPMKRGFRMRHALFSRGRMVVLSAYIFPHKPMNVAVTGHVLNECKNLQINLALSTIGNFYGEKRPPKLWPKEMIDPLVTLAMKEIKCDLTGDDPRDGLCSLRIRDTVAFETQLSRNTDKHSSWLKKIKLQKPFLEKRASQWDYRQLGWNQGGSADLHKHRIFPESRYYFRDLPYPKPTTPAAVGKYVRPTTETEIPVGLYYPMPRRHIDTRRIFTTAIHIQGASCTCTLNFVSPLIPNGPASVKPPLDLFVYKPHDPNDPNAWIDKKAASLVFGNVPVPVKKVRRFFKEQDDKYAEEQTYRENEQNLWEKMDAAQKAADKKAADDAKERERVRIHNERVAMYNHLEDIKHALTPEEFRKKYLNSAKLKEWEFADLWNMRKNGVWHYVYLHLLNDKLDIEIKEKLVKLKELEDAERAADIERWEKEEAERIRQKELKEERQRKVHEYRHNMLHAVCKRDGEDHDAYMMRRMKEAIAMKKAIGLLELEDLEAAEAAEADPEEVEEEVVVVEVTKEVDSDDDDGDYFEEGRDAPGYLANEFLDIYAPDFEVEVELYFAHEGSVQGLTIPAQSIIRFPIRCEDIYRMLPTYAERFDVLRLGYQCFFDISTEFEILAMYSKWRDIVVRKFFLRDNYRWVCMRPSEIHIRRHLREENAEFQRLRKIAADLDWNGPGDVEGEDNGGAASTSPENKRATPDKALSADAKPTMASTKTVVLEAKAESKVEPKADKPESDSDEASLPADNDDDDDDDESEIEPMELNEDGEGGDGQPPEDIPYVIPKPPLSQKELRMKRERILEQHCQFSAIPVFKNPTPHERRQTLSSNDLDNNTEGQIVDEDDRSIFSFANELSEKLVPILTWPAAGVRTHPHAIPQIIFRKTMHIKSNIKPHRTRLMFIEVWIKGCRDFGIFAYDVRDNYKIYEVELNPVFQAEKAQTYQYKTQKERNGGIHMFLAEDFIFNETECTDGNIRCMFEHKTVFDLEDEFAAAEEEDEIMNMMDDFDFEGMAAQAKEAAEVLNEEKADKMAAVKARLAEAKRLKKEENELERLGKVPMSIGSNGSIAKSDQKHIEDDSSVVSEITMNFVDEKAGSKKVLEDGGEGAEEDEEEEDGDDEEDSDEEDDDDDDEEEEERCDE